MGETVKKLSEHRRNQILDAGLSMALKHGLRGSSMEALAREAGIAKPTLYGYFPNKDALFVAVLQRILEQLEHQVEKSLNGKGDLVFRISSALVSKHKLVFSLLEGSPHREEIYSEKSRIAAREIEKFEDWLQMKISLALKESGRKWPQNYAQLLIACAEGIAQKATSVSQIGPAIRLMVEKFLA